MSNIKYHVVLSEEERKTLQSIVRTGKSPARRIMRANVLLALDENGPNHAPVTVIAQRLGVHAQTIKNIRKDYATKGLEAVLERKKVERNPKKVTGDVEAKIIAICLSEPPDGFARWTLRMVAEEAVRLEIVDSFSHTGVRSILKKTNLSLT